MNLETYPCIINEQFLNYEFYSEGPKGKIKKLVRFSQITDSDPIIYNLSFGDVLDADGHIDDYVISANNDTKRVLATVAKTVRDFISRYNDCYVFATGSTPSRTRLYQMGISWMLNEIVTEFSVFGLKNEIWCDFKKNINYSAFLVKKK